MPTYDFRCAQCGHRFTLMVSIGDKDKVTCPVCGAKKVEQVFTGCAVHTGSGGGCDVPASGGGVGG